VEQQGKLASLKQVGAGRTVGGAVKCVDIYWNADGEAVRLGLSWRWGTKAWGANRIRYPGSPRRKRCTL